MRSAHGMAGARWRGVLADETTVYVGQRRPATDSRRLPLPAPRAVLGPARTAAVFDAIRRIALQDDLASAGYLLRRSLAELTASDTVHCIFRTGGEPPEFDPSERLVTEPVGTGDSVLAVLVAARRATAEPYSPADREVVALLALHAAPILHHFLLQYQLQSRSESGAAAELQLFRPHAVAVHSAAGRHGDVLRLPPLWLRLSYRFLLAAVVTGLVYASLATVSRYAAGPAVVRIAGHTVTVAEPGTVANVKVVAGQVVRKGDVLVELAAPNEGAELEQLEVEHQNRLAGFLIDPGEPTARAALVDVATRQDRARARLAEKSARAPADGVVSDVRARPGMLLAPGDPLMTVEDDAAAPSVIALLPGGDRPELRAGMELRLALDGHRASEIRAVIDEVGSQVIGPHEARRTLGVGIGDALPIAGPVVVVHARLERSTFESSGEELPLHDGMLGAAEVEVDSRRLITALLPGGDER